MISVNLGQRTRHPCTITQQGTAGKGIKRGKQGDKEKDMKSPICGKNTKGVKVFKCTYCNFSGGSSGVVYSHMNKEHRMEKFVCSYCHFATGNKTNKCIITRHVIAGH